MMHTWLGRIELAHVLYFPNQGPYPLHESQAPIPEYGKHQSKLERR